MAQLSVRRRYLVLATVCLAAFAINLDTTIVNVALPDLGRQLAATTRDLQWIVDGYSLAFAALVLAAGSLGDRFGRRPALLARPGRVRRRQRRRGARRLGRAHWSPSRFAMGAFAAMIFPTTLSIISNTFPERRERADGARRLGRGRPARRRGRVRSPADCCSRTSAGGSVFCGARAGRAGAPGRPPACSFPSRATRTRPARPARASRAVGGDRPARLHDHRGARAAAGASRDHRRLRAQRRCLRLVFVAVERRTVAPDDRRRRCSATGVQRGERGGHGDVLRACSGSSSW